MNSPISASVLPAQPQESTVPRRPTVVHKLRKNPSFVAGVIVIALMLLMGIFAPLIATSDPIAIDPASRNRPPMTETTVRRDDGVKVTVIRYMGTDTLGRDVFSRVVYGARVSLFIGVAVSVISVAIGLFIGVLAGYFRWIDGVIMRVMDGVMAIPAILLAIALVSLARAGIATVIVAIVVPEVPRVVRLVRSVVISVRDEAYVEAARTLGTRTPVLLVRHILPNTIAPLIVQGTFICASAILVEAILSFLGIGIPTDIPTWGNIMAEGRQVFRLFPHTILFPGIFLAATILAVNMLGDGLRDTLDPKMEKRG